MKNTDQHKQYGFMLFVTCVLSFTAFLFAVDFSILDDDPVRNHAGGNVARQVEGSLAAPVRQQSAPAPQPMRAILVEAMAAKNKAAYLDGAGTALLAAMGAVVFLKTMSPKAVQIYHRFAVSQRNFSSARAPPKGA